MSQSFVRRGPPDSLILPGEFTPEETKHFGPSHHLQDRWLHARLYQWFMREGSRKCWVCIQGEGRWVYWSKGGKIMPPDDKRRYARAVVHYLNRHCNYDGAWVGAWLDDGWKRFYLLWKDEGGDIQIPMDTAGSLSWEGKDGFRNWPMDAWGNLATNAWELWRDAQEAVAAKPEQQISLAKG